MVARGSAAVRNRSRRAVWRVQIARKAADTRLAYRRNVLGGAFGFRRVGGKLTSELCYTVYVDRKLSVDLLDAKDLVPQEVRRHSIDLPTDIVESPGCSDEARFRTLLAGEAGTLGCFAVSGDRYYGVTCAHCVLGADGDPQTPETVMLEFPQADDYRFLGENVRAAYATGTGIFPTCGDDDFSLVEISEASVLAHARSRPQLRTYDFPTVPLTRGQLLELLDGRVLTAYGATSLGLRSGRITGILGHKNDRYFDLEISSIIDGAPISQKGDSGMVWCDSTGMAYGVHIWGDGPLGGQSKHAFSSLASRASRAFGIQLLGL